MKYILLFCLVVFNFSLYAQEPRFLINSDKSPEELMRYAGDLPIEITNFPSLKGFYSVKSSNPDFELKKWLEKLKDHGVIQKISPDKKVKWRDVEPNDDYYPDQWYLRRIGLPQVWDLTTGGTTSAGDTIVAAVIEQGFFLDHPDLEGQLAYNDDEIPGDSIDNDGNGYIDDYLGYNVSTENDFHPSNAHGTSVTGIMGARSNNEIGISGISWNIKILPISGIAFESDIIKALEYLLKVRMEYNSSSGQKGAYLVVNNFSAGIPGEFGDDHPELCMMYDKLGEAGVLSVNAVPNNNIDIDIEGDLPSTCRSDYLITVTSTGFDDEKRMAAAYGMEFVDVGAPGQEITTLATNSGYNENFSGTSSAAPQVSGAIALLYSIPCSLFGDFAIESPALAAILVKESLLSGVTVSPSLEHVTTSGGRLSIRGAFTELGEFCKLNPDAPLAITSAYPVPVNTGEIFFTYQTTRFEEVHSVQLIDMAGKIIYENDIIPMRIGELSSHIEIESLTAGPYILRLAHQGGDATRMIVVIF